jgi:hypothetical protein
VESAFSFDLISAEERQALIFRPYPSLCSESELGFGKPIYVEIRECDEPFPFPIRSGLRDRSWWDLRYIETGNRRSIAPTILGRNLAAELLGLTVCESLVERHLLAYPVATRTASFDPLQALVGLGETGDFKHRLRACVSALGLEGMALGITGSLLADRALGLSNRDLDLVVCGEHSRILDVARRIRRFFLNTHYQHQWPLKAVLGPGLEVDLFFAPLPEVVEIARSFQCTDADLRTFSGIVADAGFNVYAPTVVRCDAFVCVLLGTAARGQYQAGDKIVGRGIYGTVLWRGELCAAYLIEDPVIQLTDVPRLRVEKGE